MTRPTRSTRRKVFEIAFFGVLAGGVIVWGLSIIRLFLMI